MDHHASQEMVQLSINKKLKVWKQVKERLEYLQQGQKFRNTFFFKDHTYGVRSNGRDSLRICKWFQQIKTLFPVSNFKTPSKPHQIMTLF